MHSEPSVGQLPALVRGLAGGRFHPMIPPPAGQGFIIVADSVAITVRSFGKGIRNEISCLVAVLPDIAYTVAVVVDQGVAKVGQAQPKKANQTKWGRPKCRPCP